MMPLLSPIELSPNSKRSLTLANPIILASGEMGVSGVGAIVTPPLTQRPRTGAPFPRVVEVPGGVLLRTGAANPGLARFAREHEREWSSGRIPIIAAFAAQAAPAWAEMAAQAERTPGIAGIELDLNSTIRAAEAIRATRAATELPILAKVELEDAAPVGAECIEAGANALVIGRAPRGMALVSGSRWFGRLYSPTTKPLVLRALADVAVLDLGAPLVASGGVYSPGDVDELMGAGAVAVQVDSALWLDPALLSALVSKFG